MVLYGPFLELSIDGAVKVVTVANVLIISSSSRSSSSSSSSSNHLFAGYLQLYTSNKPCV